MEVARWSVLYTKHKTQKTKSYHDGTLAVKSYTPTQIKVFLVDDEGRKLEDKYLTAGEQVGSGLSIEFQGYRVNIEEPLEDQAICSQMVASEMAPPLASHATPSIFRQKTIPDLLRGRAQTSSAASSSGRWIVTYSDTSGSKRRKWHDGLLMPFPNNPRKVSLLGNNESKLMEKFLEKDDVLAAGNTVQLGPYEVSIETAEQEQSTGSCAGMSDKCDERTSVLANKVSPWLKQKAVVSSKVERREQVSETKKEPPLPKTKQESTKRTRTVSDIMQCLKRSKASTHLEHQDTASQPKERRTSSCHPKGVSGYEGKDPLRCQSAEQRPHTSAGMATIGQQVEEKMDAVTRESKKSPSKSPSPVLADASSASKLSGSSWPYQSAWTPAKALRVQAMRESQRPFRSPYKDTVLVSEEKKVLGKSKPSLDGACNPVGAVVDGGIKFKVKRTSNAGVNESEVVIQDSLDFSAEHSVCSDHMEQVLADHNFMVVDFWEGYKLYCHGYYSSSESHRRSFSRSKMGQVLRDMYEETSFVWGARFDDKVRSAWSFMEDYLQQRHGVHCTDISVLLDKFEDAEELKATADGRLLLAIAKDNCNLASHPSAELALRNSKRISQNNILERIDQELDRAGTGLANLQRHTEQVEARGNRAQHNGSGQSTPEEGICEPVNRASPGPRKQVGRMEDDSPVWLVEGRPGEVLPFLPSVPSSVATARFCKEVDRSDFGEVMSDFTFESRGSTWVCETGDSWSQEEEDCVYALSSYIVKACRSSRCDNMLAVVSTSVTALLKEEQHPWWIFSISFIDIPEQAVVEGAPCPQVIDLGDDS